MTTTKPIIELSAIENRFGDHVVHDGINLRVERGEAMGLVGGSGSGKTTLLRTIMGQLRPTNGVVRVFGEDIGEISGDDWRRLRTRWGVLFQGGALFSNLTVAENVALPLREFGFRDRSLIEELVTHRLSEVDLSHAADRLPSELSGGMIKRAGLARALALDPELLLLDEPTSGLDPVSSESFVALMEQLQTELGLTIFMISHDLDTLIDLCDRVAVLADRKVVALAPPLELGDHPHPFVSEFFGGRRGSRARAGSGLEGPFDPGSPGEVRSRPEQ